ncbi:hypothetical protein DFH28DRAFT_25853 [Melampsora americana]|nr:hypothetical protein DFH28DRAFT_25853 [Melampsora americana]
MESKLLFMAIFLSLCLPSLQNSITSTTSTTFSNIKYSSNTTTSSTGNIHVHSGFSVILKSYSLGESGVMCQHRARPNTVQPGNNLVGTPVAVNLTSVNCQVQCYPSTYQPPNEGDCKHLIDTFRLPELGSVTIQPETRLYVSYQTCLVVFENQRKENPLVEYTWQRLGCETNRVVVQCETSPYEQPEGGSCIFGKRHMTDSYSVQQGRAYMNLRHSGIQISVQAARKTINESADDDPN